MNKPVNKHVQPGQLNRVQACQPRQKQTVRFYMHVYTTRYFLVMA